MERVSPLVGERYQLVAHLGGGKTSDVSLATQRAGGTLHVLKRLKLGADAEPDTIAAFTREAKLSLLLQHPNVARGIETGEDADGPFLVVEYVEGQTLARLRSRAKRRAAGIPRAVALHVVREVARALAYLHDLADAAGKPLKLVHRDVSPENIIVSFDGSTKLVDFSLAGAAASKADAVLPRGGLAYVAPEQVGSTIQLDARADVFALGVVFWELLTGSRMWEGLSEAEVTKRLADEAPMPSARSVAPDVPEALDAICSQALAKIRDDRFDSAADLGEALEKAARTLGLEATDRDVGELVASLFAAEHAQRKTAVQEALAAPGAHGETLPQLGRAPPPKANQFVDVETDPSLWIGAAPVATTRVVEVLRVEQAPSPDRRFAIAISGAVLIAFAVVALVALTRKDPPVAAKPPPRTTTAAAPSSTDPAPSATAEPVEVTIDIAVRPLKAKLFVDGLAVTNPHRVRIVRGKYAHQVRAEADAFETRTMTVAFDRDRAIDIALVPKPFVPAAPAPRSSRASDGGEAP